MADPVFEAGDFVTIDGKGKAEIIEKVHRGFGTFYEIKVCDIGFQCEIESKRLAKYIEESASTSAQQTTRFVPVHDNDIDHFIDGQSNKNTLQKTCSDLKIFREFLCSPEINESREIQNIPVPELQAILCKFFIAVRRSDGQEYEPNSLRSMMASFDRQLRRYNYGEYISTGPNFAKVREVLRCKQMHLKREGKGNLSKRADPITDAEVEKLWETGQLGTSTPDAILNTLWFYNTVHFGLRGCAEHREMEWGDVVLKSDSNGHEYLEFHERQTKTRTGINPRDVRQVTPKLWANLENPARDPVNIFKIYRSKRPVNYCEPEHPFYIATTTKHLPTNGDIWFKRNPVGINKLSTIMNRMIRNAGITTDKHLSNHSARKYLIQKLSDNNIPPNQIMQISGHKNISSINNYSHLNETQHLNISSILHSSSSRQNEVLATGNSVQAVSSFRSESKSASMHIQGGFNSVFASQIHGGNFEIHIHQKENSSPPCIPPRKRIRINESDSDSQ